MSKLDEHHDQFDDRNVFLQVLLGLVSGGRTLEMLLMAHGPAPVAPEAERAAQLDAFLDAVVGLVSLSQGLNRHLDAAAASAADAAAAPSVTPPASLRGYLA